MQHGVLARHAAKASLLWLQRDAAVVAPHYWLRQLSELDLRLEAHLDALRLAGAKGQTVVDSRLERPQLGDFFTAVQLAAATRDYQGLDELLELVLLDPMLDRAGISALAWCEHALCQEICEAKLLSAPSPVLRRMGLAAMANQRQELGHWLARCLADANTALRERAFHAVGELGAIDQLPNLLSAIDTQQGPCRTAAAGSALLIGSDRGIAVLREAAEAGGPRAAWAGSLATRRMESQHFGQWVELLLARPEQQRLGLWVIGQRGHPTWMPRLLSAMTEPALARGAGEAFSMLTGINIAEDLVDGVRARGPALVPRSIEQRRVAGIPLPGKPAAVVQDVDGDLPWPAADALASYWQRHQGEYDPQSRYLLGKPIDESSAIVALRTGAQRQRAAAAIELALLQAESPLFEVRAPGFKQR